MKLGRLEASLDPSTSSPEVHDMDGKRTLAGGLMAIVALTSACSSAPAAVPSSSAAASASPESQASVAPGASQTVSKGGGNISTPLAATLATVVGEGVDEKDLADTLRQVSA